MIAKASLPKDLQGAIESFDAWVDAKLESQPEADKVQQTLYQYTTAAGLKGIFETQQLWFTDYRYLNDPGEFRYGLDLARKTIDDANSEVIDPKQAIFLETVRDLLSSERMDLGLRVFISCFSRARNDLGQWRAYGDNGHGFAIGFSHQMFRIVDAEGLSPVEKTFVTSVTYDTEHASNRHRESINEACKIYLKAAVENENLLHDPTIMNSFIRELTMSLVGGQLIWDSITAKHPAYSYEEEVRQVIFGAVDSLAGEIKTRVRGSEIVPYVAAPWRVREKGMIEEIVVGPAASLGAEEAVIAMLRSYGVDGVKVTCPRSCVVDGVKVTRSKIPYRPV